MFAVHPDKTRLLEAGEGSGDDLAHGSDTGRHLLVGDGEVELESAAVAGPAHAGFGEQEPGEAPVDIVERERLHQPGAGSDASCQDAQSGESDGRLLGQQGPDILAREKKEHGILFGGGGRGIGAFVKDGNLADRGAGVLDVNYLLAAVGADAKRADGALDDDVEAAGDVAGKEQDFAAPELLLDGAIGKRLELGAAEVAEQRRARERRYFVDRHIWRRPERLQARRKYRMPAMGHWRRCGSF